MDQIVKTAEVHHPDHYGGDSIYETIKVKAAWLTPEQFIGFCRGDALKYQPRAGKKDPDRPGVDLAKAKFYFDYEQDYRRCLIEGKVGEGRWAERIKVIRSEEGS